MIYNASLFDGEFNDLSLSTQLRRTRYKEYSTRNGTMDVFCKVFKSVLHHCHHLDERYEMSIFLVLCIISSFYRAMHFSAKRGIAIACRLSVCLSVCLSVTLVNCDHIGWNSSKIISPLVSLGCSLFATPTWRVCSMGNTPKFGPKVTHPPIDLSVGDIRSQIAAEWLQIAQRSQWRAYRKLPSLFLMVSSLTPTTSPSPIWGFICPHYTRMAISLQWVIRSTSCLVPRWGFRGLRI